MYTKIIGLKMPFSISIATILDLTCMLAFYLAGQGRIYNGVPQIPANIAEIGD